jgi:hypothetical protein
MSGVIHVALRATRPHPYSAIRRIDPHPPHKGEINHQPVIATSQSRPIVTSAAYGGEKIVFPTKSHGEDYIGYIGATSDEQWPLVDHAIIQLAGFLVTLVASLD